jgi:hypothetical protein
MVIFSKPLFDFLSLLSIGYQGTDPLILPHLHNPVLDDDFYWDRDVVINFLQKYSIMAVPSY